jgi:predicted TIM-barrel fold metal-dependent hydrolase
MRAAEVRVTSAGVIDVHSHTWEYPRHFGDDFRDQARRARGGVEMDLSVRFEEYRSTCPPQTRTIVFGGKARRSGLWVDDDHVARYVAQHPRELIGFLACDPTQDGWEAEMRRGHEELGLRGIKLMPMYAGFRPDDEKLDALWRYAMDRRLPVLLHTGTTFVRQAPLECTLPRHLDAVAIRFPDVKIIMAHLGHPYEGECVAVIRKHPNVYADISALHYRPFQLYHSLMLVQEYGVWEKVLFGSDYPFTTVDASIDGLRKLNAMLEGTALPRLDAARVEAMIHRDSLGLLGLSDGSQGATA